jgi:hypothetical protein
MADSRTMWFAKTIGIVVIAAVVTALLTHYLQVLLWGKSNVGVSGGAASGVAVAVAMSRRRRVADEKPM